MKKMIFAAILGLLSVSSVAYGIFGFGRRNGNGCCQQQTSCCGVAQATCAEACVEEPAVPICTKTVMVPKTIQVPKVIQVPARKIVIPQPDVCERIAQAPKCIRIPVPAVPQPDEIRYEAVPDKIVYHKQAPLIRYECPSDTRQCGQLSACDC